MKRGRKPEPNETKIVRGTFRQDQARQPVVQPLEGAIAAPTWVKGQALRVWRDKTEIYRRRGQSVTGCEGALAQYCAVEADLIDRWKRRVEVPVALINAHRIYANEFYDTPASQQAAGQKTPGGNRFSGNGQPPAAAKRQA